MLGLFIFILIIGCGGFVAFRLLAPEMYLTLDRSKINFPWSKGAKLIPDAVSIVPVAPESIKMEELPVAIDLPVQQDELLEPVVDKTIKLEALLYEKNKAIERLTQELDAEKAHRQEFEKVKDVMTQEILRLKNQLKQAKKNKEFDHA